MDRISPEKRSWNMSRIKSKDTTPERIVRSFLHRNGFRFRLHVKDLPDKPDIVLPKYKTVIEVRGCYWHRHEGCKYAYMPKTRIEFWQKKFNENIRRDKVTYQMLSESGFKVSGVCT
ncbi:MAG: DNA mismatch endonuclease Vsr [Acholeplasmataceae bacterium]|nr:DNA mismatch endonuclease Vsr [Acholeplasmataceae bacterium]